MEEEEFAYIDAEKNTGNNRLSESVAGNAVANAGVNNNRKAGSFLQNAYGSGEINPGYSIL